jgi:hypothetical protein
VALRRRPVTLVGVEAIEDAANAYLTDKKRPIFAKVQLRDRKILESSRVRAALVPATDATLTFAEVGGTGDTITRTAGSFVTDGFQAGDYIRVTGSLSNNVSGKITASPRRCSRSTPRTSWPKCLATGGAITAEPSFVFASTTITRNRGSWVSEGFAIGDHVTVAGSASNNGTAIVTAISATVLTCAASTFVSETAGSVSVSVTLTESYTAHVAAMDALVASVDDSPRIDIGFGRLKKRSPILGYKMRRPVQWADTTRSYQHDVKTTTWQKDLGALDGWDIEGEFDEAVDGGALAARFTCARTWENGPNGAFIAQSLTRAGDDSILSMTHNMAVSNVAQAATQRATEMFVGRTLVLKAPDTLGRRYAEPRSLVKLKAEVDKALADNVLSNIGGEGQRASQAYWTPATDDNLGVTARRSTASPRSTSTARSFTSTLRSRCSDGTRNSQRSCGLLGRDRGDRQHRRRHRARRHRHQVHRLSSEVKRGQQKKGGRVVAQTTGEVTDTASCSMYRNALRALKRKLVAIAPKNARGSGAALEGEDHARHHALVRGRRHERHLHAQAHRLSPRLERLQVRGGRRGGRGRRRAQPPRGRRDHRRRGNGAAVSDEPPPRTSSTTAEAVEEATRGDQGGARRGVQGAARRRPRSARRARREVRLRARPPRRPRRLEVGRRRRDDGRRSHARRERARYRKFEQMVSKAKADTDDGLKAGTALADVCIVYPPKDSELLKATLELAAGIKQVVALQIIKSVQGKAEKEKKD